ncbi:MAG: porin [Sphingomonadales bacterium]|nr:porin [Sphingomonadales bacterium]NCQ20427.1 porin [Sphingomonadales bacterium]NCT03035.1 porin [Sphingomonadales bacterium]
MLDHRFLRNAARIGFAGALLAAAPAVHADEGLPRIEFQWEGFDIRLSGGAASQAAVFDDDDSRTDSPDAKVDLFARLNAQWTSPGGIIIGANVEQNSRRRASEVLEAGEIYGFVASDYGRLEVGLQDGPADTLAFAAPLVALGQVRGEFSRYAGTQALLRALDTQDAFKVIYLSPPIGGLRGGVSYSPKVRRNATAVDSRERISVNNAFEFGLQYQQPVGDWILGASGGYVTGNADAVTTRADLRSWSVGAEARRGPLRIGGAYVDRGDSNRLDRDFDQWEINGGVGWITPIWGVAGSVAYTNASDRKNRLFGVGGFYRIHPNVELRADVVKFREERLPIAVDDGIASVIEVTFII